SSKETALKRSKKPSTTEEEPEVGEPPAASSSSVVVPSESHRGIIDKTALLVAKGGEGYEDRILREQDHSRFYFLKPGDVHRPYYEQKLAECRARIALASGTAKASAPVEPERPLVALDYHHTIEFNQTVSEVTVQHLQDIQRWGYDLTICSFSSNSTTQELELVVVELRVLFLLRVIATLRKEDQGFKVDTLYLLLKAQVKK
ncbi:unnamed protein product, partial [Cladocopium goreaui]